MAGITLVVASGDDPQIIADIVSEKAEATYFRPQLSKIQSRKIWIQAATKTSGSVVIDDGAVQALMQDGLVFCHLVSKKCAASLSVAAVYL